MVDHGRMTIAITDEHRTLGTTAAELLLPPVVVLPRVRVNGLVIAAVVLDVEDLIPDEAGVPPGRPGPRRTNGDQMVDRPLVDTGETHARGRVAPRYRHIDRNNPAHGRHRSRSDHRTPHNSPAVRASTGHVITRGRPDGNGVGATPSSPERRDRRRGGR